MTAPRKTREKAAGQRRSRRAGSKRATPPGPRKNLRESPLSWLASRRGPSGRPLLSPAQVEAGERLRRDFTKAGLTPRVTQNWTCQPGTAPAAGQAQGFHPTELGLAAKQRFFRALNALGPGLGDVALRVCCHLEGLEQAEEGLGWPRRSAKLVLTLALDRLAAHYGLDGAMSGKPGIAAWRMPGTPDEVSKGSPGREPADG